MIVGSFAAITAALTLHSTPAPPVQGLHIAYCLGATESLYSAYADLENRVAVLPPKATIPEISGLTAEEALPALDNTRRFIGSLHNLYEKVLEPKLTQVHRQGSKAELPYLMAFEAGAADALSEDENDQERANTCLVKGTSA